MLQHNHNHNHIATTRFCQRFTRSISLPPSLPRSLASYQFTRIAWNQQSLLAGQSPVRTCLKLNPDRNALNKHLLCQSLEEIPIFITLLLIHYHTHLPSTICHPPSTIYHPPPNINYNHTHYLESYNVSFFPRPPLLPIQFCSPSPRCRLGISPRVSLFHCNSLHLNLETTQIYLL